MAKLYFYFAAMNAGKSTTLLQADFHFFERLKGSEARQLNLDIPRGLFDVAGLSA